MTVQAVQRQKTFDLLGRLGVPLDTERNANWYDGLTIPAGPAMRPQNILHEAAHWILATPTSRRLVNFGLGPDPDGDTPEDIESPDGDQEAIETEVLASGLGILFVAMTDGDYQGTLAEHAWEQQESDAEIREAAVLARAAGIKIPTRIVSKVCAGFQKLREGHEKWRKTTTFVEKAKTAPCKHNWLGTSFGVAAGTRGSSGRGCSCPTARRCLTCGRRQIKATAAPTADGGCRSRWIAAPACKRCELMDRARKDGQMRAIALPHEIGCRFS